MRSWLFTLFFLCSVTSICQIPIGQWRVHLPYSSGINVEPAGNKVYCFSTGGLFVYSLVDNTVEKLTKVNGLSDVVISALQYIPEKNTLVIGYENGNIDIIQNNIIYNISDILRKQLTGSKTINNINYLNGMTYLSCGFGIVLLDVDKQEIKDPVIIFCQVSFNSFHVIIVLIFKYKTGFSRKGCTTRNLFAIFLLWQSKTLNFAIINFNSIFRVR